ncbi:MAG: DNA repair protein RecO [Clostridia bacterium]|nr:DNA repair protein RecO [Clostridia bacterium]
MTETIKGVVLRETAIGDYDKIMTVLTADRGKISVFARGAKRLKSPLFTATQIFSYSEMTIYRSANHYYLRSADLIENFYRMRDYLEGSALAGYIADIAADISVENQDETELLRLVLNCFHAIAFRIKPPLQIKGVFELRAASAAGFMPNLIACAGCGDSDLDIYYFDVTDGVFRCEECYRTDALIAEKLSKRQSEPDAIYQTGQIIALLSPSVFAAMRFAIYSKAQRIFSFELKDRQTLLDFSKVAENYLLCHLEKNYATLDFYHAVSEVS